jgi:hypothetical protein
MITVPAGVRVYVALGATAILTPRSPQPRKDAYDRRANRIVSPEVV